MRFDYANSASERARVRVSMGDNGARVYAYMYSARISANERERPPKRRLRLFIYPSSRGKRDEL